MQPLKRSTKQIWQKYNKRTRTTENNYDVLRDMVYTWSEYTMHNCAGTKICGSTWTVPSPTTPAICQQDGWPYLTAYILKKTESQNINDRNHISRAIYVNIPSPGTTRHQRRAGKVSYSSLRYVLRNFGWIIRHSLLARMHMWLARFWPVTLKACAGLLISPLPFPAQLP